MRELAGLRKFKFGRFRIVYELDREALIIRIFAIGHRREVYKDLTDRFVEKAGKNTERVGKIIGSSKSDCGALQKGSQGIYASAIVEDGVVPTVTAL